MAALKLIKIGSKGSDVENWQYFLLGLGFYKLNVDGDFGFGTLKATIDFQKSTNLHPDGVVGNKTYGAAMLLNFKGIIDARKDKFSANWPKKPNFPPLTINSERQAIFGKFAYKAAPVIGNRERIVISDNWQKENIVTVRIPQLKQIWPTNNMPFHKLGEDQLINLWDDWEKMGLLPYIFTYGGSFVPRFIRGSSKTLSNHAFGSAFDINADWNRLGALPALVGQKGSVRELVSAANKNGFYWGGHFSRQDGMHFEIARIL